MTPWDFVNGINSNKNLMRDTDNDEMSEKEYNAFIVNRAMSYFLDTLEFANEMNMHHELDNRPQFEYLLNSTRPRKRFTKWGGKPADNEDLDLVMAKYNVNRRVAKQYLSLLSKENLLELRANNYKGGTKK